MRIFFAGDVESRSGRESVYKHLPGLKEKLGIDVAIVNGENAAHGSGITAKICKELYAAGVDCITLGNHTWGQPEIMLYIDSDPRLVRPVNYPKDTPGRGSYVHQLADGRKILVINALGRVYMDPQDDPFAATKAVIESHDHRMGRAVNAVLVDFHAEASSEKMAFGHYFDGQVSAVVGSHTSIPTADAQILPKGTAYQTDAGMCGDYNSVIGAKIDVPIRRFTRKLPRERLTSADGEGTMCGIFIETNDDTGRALRIEPVRLGPRLIEAMPVL